MRNHSIIIGALAGLAFLTTFTSPVEGAGYCILDGTFNLAGSFSSGSTAFAIGVQSDGKVVAGGNFTYNGNYPNGCPFTANNLVRFNANGTVDTAYNPSPNGTVRALLVQPDDKVIIGGSFAQVSGLSQTCISRLTTATGYPDYICFQAPVPNNYVTA